MDRGGKMMVSLLALPAFVVGTQAVRSFGASSDDPYQAIMDRNVFDLRAKPEALPGPSTATPPPNVKLVGLMMVTGHPQAVISIVDQSGPNKQPETYILAEEQRHASVEVKSIDMDRQTARVSISGDVVQLKLEKMLAAPAGPGPAGAPAMAGARQGGRGTFPVPGARGPAAPAPTSYQPTANPENSALPARPVRSDSGEQQALTPEQSLVQMEQTREMYQQNGDVRAQLLPPNPLYNALQAQQQQAAAGGGSTGNQPNTATQPQSPVFGSRRTGTMVSAPMPP